VTVRDAIADLHILVVGDVMLDEYWFGDVQRISPEAPVPVVRVERSDERPGGAANVARNIVALGAQATLLSVVGADAAADRLRSVLDGAQVLHRLQADPHIRTTVKLRVIGQQQQMLRIDFEDKPSPDALDAKKLEFERVLDAADLVVFSDYRKGALDHVDELIALVRAKGKPVLVDPKGDTYARYAGATAITPNRKELADVKGNWASFDDMVAKASALRDELGVEALLLTMSEQGMLLVQKDGVQHKPANAREVFDVSGAGDTVIAALAVMMGIGVDWSHALDFANAAAGLVVAKLGTSAVDFDEVAPLLPDIDSWTLAA
jgi:rfaE bifunctional protein kinase chain/domain